MEMRGRSLLLCRVGLNSGGAVGVVGRWDGGTVGRWDGGTVGRWGGGRSASHLKPDTLRPLSRVYDRSYERLLRRRHPYEP